MKVPGGVKFEFVKVSGGLSFSDPLRASHYGAPHSLHPEDKKRMPMKGAAEGQAVACEGAGDTYYRGEAGPPLQRGEGGARGSAVGDECGLRGGSGV